MAFQSPSLRSKIKAMAFSLPGMIDCAEFDSFILSYLDEDLSAAELKTFNRHLAICRECREYLAAYKATLELVDGAANHARQGDLSEPPEDLIKAIVAARSQN